jgi:hypothetical protein
MRAAASRITLKVPMRLMRTARSKVASECGPLRPTTRSPGAMPAQLIAPWIAPKAERKARPAAVVAASSVTSVRRNLAFGAELLRDRLPAFVHVGDDDLRALGDEHRRGRGAEARAAAGDEECVVLIFMAVIPEGCGSRRWAGRARAPTLPMLGVLAREASAQAAT